jgi:UPF0716 protein FxsA
VGGFSRQPGPERGSSQRSGPQVIDLDEDEFSRTDGRGRTDPNDRDRLK